MSDSAEINKGSHGIVDEDDVVDKMLDNTGCANLHYKVQECIAEHKDWRKCQREVLEFRICIESHKKKFQE